MLLPAAPEAAFKARQSLSEFRASLDPRVFADLRLLISELVTNSLRHAGLSGQGQIRLRVTLSDRAVRAEVCDTGPGFTPKDQAPSLYRQSGWGLFLVKQIADRWGIDQKGDSCVWFELDRFR
ncbi:MAG TPA: ATP-binding protein [Actinomycetota bacterium]|nr:ATP-binding protein [Actinomycetota bacterium]